MIRLYDKVRIRSTGKTGFVVETDDDGGTRPTIYLVELEHKPADADITEVIIWCDWDEIEPV